MKLFEKIESQSMDITRIKDKKNLIVFSNKLINRIKLTKKVRVVLDPFLENSENRINVNFISSIIFVTENRSKQTVSPLSTKGSTYSR